MYTCMCICAACLHVHTYKYSTHQTLPTHRRGAVPFVCSCPCDSSLSTWVAHSGLFSPWLFLDHKLPAGQSDAHWVSLSPSRTCWNHSTFAAYISGCRYNNYMPTHVLMCLHIYTWNIQKKILKANFKFCGGKYAPPKSLSICMGLYFQTEATYKRNEHNIRRVNHCATEVTHFRLIFTMECNNLTAHWHERSAHS